MKQVRKVKPNTPSGGAMDGTNPILGIGKPTQPQARRAGFGISGAILLGALAVGGLAKCGGSEVTQKPGDVMTDSSVFATDATETTISPDTIKLDTVKDVAVATGCDPGKTKLFFKIGDKFVENGGTINGFLVQKAEDGTITVAGKIQYGNAGEKTIILTINPNGTTQAVELKEDGTPGSALVAKDILEAIGFDPTEMEEFTQIKEGTRLVVLSMNLGGEVITKIMGDESTVLFYSSDLQATAHVTGVYADKNLQLMVNLRVVAAGNGTYVDQSALVAKGEGVVGVKVAQLVQIDCNETPVAMISIDGDAPIKVNTKEGSNTILLPSGNTLIFEGKEAIVVGNPGFAVATLKDSTGNVLATVELSKEVTIDDKTGENVETGKTFTRVLGGQATTIALVGTDVDIDPANPNPVNTADASSEPDVSTQQTVDTSSSADAVSRADQ